MSSDDDHGELAAAWKSVRGAMDGIPQRLRWESTEYMEVTEKADRVRSLSMHLDSAVELAAQLRYPPSLALIRTSLEHCVIDWLVFLGRTLIQRFAHIDDATWAEWQSARAAGEDWTRTIRDWTRTRKGDVRIVREGMFSEPDESGNRSQISVYYFLLEQYRPTIGPPASQRETWAISNEDLRRIAGENDALWRTYLTWSSLPRNLQENGLVDELDAGRLATHYRFLSGYSHPLVDQRRTTYGKDASMGWPKYDHYSSELVLLYAITIGCLELDNFVLSLHNRAGTSLADLGELRATLDSARIAVSYFWFLGTHPTEYDTWKARNKTAFRPLRSGNGTAPPADPTPEDVPYPTDPLRRLVALHQHANEITTGFQYVSSWHRPDAALR